MNYAIASNGVTGFGQSHTGRGITMVNFGSGSSSEVAVFSRVDKMNIHGGLMAAAWVLLLPMGSLTARHR